MTELRISSNFKTVISGLRRRRKGMPTLLRRALMAHGQRYIRTMVREFMSGRPGVNRVTGHGARGWHQLVIPQGAGLMLLVWNNVPYVLLHTDDPDAPSSPRMRPMRIPSAKVWDDMSDDGQLVASMRWALTGRRGTNAPGVIEKARVRRTDGRFV